MKLITVQSEQNVIEELCKLVESSAKSAIERSGHFRIGLSGGSLIKYLCHGLPNITTDWPKWQLFFCDERYVPDTDLDSTFGAYNDLLVKKVEQLSAEQFTKINVDLELSECARDYEQKIRDTFNMPEVIILILKLSPCLRSSINHSLSFSFPFPLTHFATRRAFPNSIYCSWEWAQMDTPVRCSPVIRCWQKRIH